MHTKSDIMAVIDMFISDDKEKSTLETAWEDTSGSDLRIEFPYGFLYQVEV